MTVIHTKNTSLAFAQFTSNQGLSYHDICHIFDCTLDEARTWTFGNAPQHINQVCILANEVLEKTKLVNMNDVDRQHFEHRAELLTKENERLKVELAAYKRTATPFQDNISRRYKDKDDVLHESSGSADERGAFRHHPIKDPALPVTDKKIARQLNNIFNAAYSVTPTGIPQVTFCGEID